MRQRSDFASAKRMGEQGNRQANWDRMRETELKIEQKGRSVGSTPQGPG